MSTTSAVLHVPHVVTHVGTVQEKLGPILPHHHAIKSLDVSRERLAADLDWERDADGGTAVSHTISEGVHVARLVLAGQALLIACMHISDSLVRLHGP